jgi:adenylate kinase
MNIIVLGPQASGKGTQVKMLVEKYGLQPVEMGKILRSIAASENQHAKVVKEFQDKGDLVPDEFVRLIAWDYINKHDKNKGFVFDGYPRSIDQFEHVQDMLMKFGKKVDLVFFINISEAEIERRLDGRRNCAKCGLIYNLITGPIPPGPACSCGGELVRRSDDNQNALIHRLEYYQEKVLPLVSKTKSLGILREVNGEQSIEAIHEDIIRIIEKDINHE